MSQLPHKSIIRFLPQIKHSRQRPRLRQSISLDAAADQLLVPWCCSVSHPVPADQLQPKQEDYVQRSEITAQSVAQGQFSTLHPVLWKVLWPWPRSWHTGGTFPAALSNQLQQRGAPEWHRFEVSWLGSELFLPRTLWYTLPRWGFVVHPPWKAPTRKQFLHFFLVYFMKWQSSD